MYNTIRNLQKTVIALWCLLSFAECGFGQNSSIPTLNVGDPAPPIVYAKWLKGKPLTELEQGKIYVVDFWATWCGPCRESMPELSELANKYKEKVTIIGMNVHELSHKKNANNTTVDYVSKVERFVKKADDIMDYSVAVDRPDDTMWNTWLKAAGAGALPTVFIIDKNKNIAWIGDPGSLDEVLELVINNQYNELIKKQLQETRKQDNLKYKEVFAKYKAALDSGNDKAALELMPQLIAIRPSVADYMDGVKYAIFAKSDPAKAALLGREMVKKYQKNPIELGGFADNILNMKEGPGFRPDYPLALQAIQLAYAHSEKDDQWMLRTLAKAYYKNGNITKAIELQSQAVDILKKSEFVDYPQDFVNNEQKVLEQYKAEKR